MDVRSLKMFERVVCITGSGARIGAYLAQHLHAQGWRVILHARQHRQQADQLAAQMNQHTPHSACVVQGDLTDDATLSRVAVDIGAAFGRLDALIHNASSFYATPMGQATLRDWDDLFGSNARAPFFFDSSVAAVVASTAEQCD
jgi:pteridine reductase